ncbi:MAG: class I SAM-dependent methyltransferase, partial [Proteobacteria bacterium]|nr:class I SAM-dependent methyltransferase [Pseudomonadota bacterium]
LAAMPLTGARVLNLFAYSGMLGRIAERAGAAQLVQVDQSERALAFAAAHHTTDRARHDFVVTDAFAYKPEGLFDVAIVDPPSMTSSMDQIPVALAAYRKLYSGVAAHVKPGGLVVAACCTSRIQRKVFRDTVKRALGGGFTLERELPAELDHPVGFPQADYLKISLWRRALT